MPQNQHIQRKLLNFEFWIKAPKFDIQSQFSMSKIVQNFLIFFSFKNSRAHWHFLMKSNFRLLYLLKWCPIFDSSPIIQNSNSISYKSGRWKENKEIWIASTAFLQRNKISTAILNAQKNIKLYLEIVVLVLSFCVHLKFYHLFLWFWTYCFKGIFAKKHISHGHFKYIRKT